LRRWVLRGMRRIYWINQFGSHRYYCTNLPKF
jgi:hypothetical protein